MGRVEQIEARLAEFDKWQQVIDTSNKDYDWNKANEARNRIDNHCIDDIRALVAVVRAAAAIDKEASWALLAYSRELETEEALSSKAKVMGDQIDALYKALKALDEGKE